MDSETNGRNDVRRSADLRPPREDGLGVGGFKAEALEWIEQKLGNNLPKKDGLNTSFFIATADKACPLGERSLSRSAFAARLGARQPRNADPCQ